MSEPACVFCPVVEALGRSETYQPSGSASVYRRIEVLPASIAILANDQFYPGYSLVIAKTHATELYQLSEHESTQYFQDMLRVAKAVAAAFTPNKMNYELLGNTVGHLHWHLFPRYAWDPNPARPTWEHAHPPKSPSASEYAATIAAIRRGLG
ncbi:MAG: HIT family protein [Candidatus Rokuibacteriota bacterium]